MKRKISLVLQGDVTNGQRDSEIPPIFGHV